MRLLTSTWVVPVARPPIRDGLVAMEDGRIVWIGEPRSPGAPDARVEDLGPGVILPGLVNAHCHLELSWLEGQLHLPQPFVAWVRDLVSARARETREAVRSGAARAVRQLLEAGTVAVGDVSNSLAHLDLLEASELQAVVFYELLGWDPARAEAILTEASARLATLPGGRLRVSLAAHAPHSVSPELLAGLVRQGGPASLHVAESPAESRFLRAGDAEWSAFLQERGLGGVAFRAPGLSPVQHLDALGALHPGVLAAHCVQTDASDQRLLARRGVRVVVCPRSNRNLEVGLPPLPELLAAGVRLSLGSDSLASAETLDVLDDVRALRQAFPELPAEALVRMATLGGAEALGLGELGSIEPGKRAALVHASADATPDDPLEFVVSTARRLTRLAA